MNIYDVKIYVKSKCALYISNIVIVKNLQHQRMAHIVGTTSGNLYCIEAYLALKLLNV